MLFPEAMIFENRYMGRGGSVVGSVPYVQKVTGSPPRMDLGQVFRL